MVMGCGSSQSYPDPGTSPLPQVDPRLPFQSYRQLFSAKNAWKAVSRSLANTAVDCLIRLLRKHPEYKDLFSDFANLDTEEKMKNSLAFENASVAIFNVIDEAVEKMDKVEQAIQLLRDAGTAHKRIPNFSSLYFQDMEEPFIEACRETLGEIRFHEKMEQIYRDMFGFLILHISEGFGPD